MPQTKPLKTIAGDPQTPIEIDEGRIVIPCYVLEGEIRVITEKGLYNALALARTGRKTNPTNPSEDLWAEIDPQKKNFPKSKLEEAKIVTDLPRFAQAKWLQPHLSAELTCGLKTRYMFQLPNSAIAYGIEARVLRGVCSAIMAAHRAGHATERNQPQVIRAEILLEGFADIGIIGLIDQATGYQAVKETMAKILDEFIAKELRPWIKEFPDAYYGQIYRLWEYDKPEEHKNHPQFIARLTNKLIYEPLAPGVLEALQKANPISENGSRKNKHHQHLTENVGLRHLRKQIDRVVTLMEIHDTKEDFHRVYNKHYGTGQTYMEFMDDIST